MYNIGFILIKYPPKNNILVNIQISTILAYSAKKKIQISLQHVQS